ncbi:MAG: lysostaphin resistance A-like protein [Planctomycetota bacterium]
MNEVAVLFLVGMGLLLFLAGRWLWRRQAERLTPLGVGETSAHGLQLFLVGLAVSGLLPFLVSGFFSLEPLSLSRALLLQTLFNLAGLGALLVLAAFRRTGLPALGLRRQRGGSPWQAALAAWLMAFPIFVAAGLAYAAVLTELGYESSVQKALRLFQEDPSAQRSPIIWTTAVLILPAFEELFFRGALYGGLRRLLSPSAAVTLAAVTFGLMHGTSAALPIIVLGAALCLLYERTGSLAAPLLFHALHNGLTLAMVVFVPELAGVTGAPG